MLTHLDANHQPAMVDITAKTETPRMAVAQAIVQLPTACQTYLQGDELVLKKGPVFQTAIIAGTMAVKRTSDVIPFCHGIPIESCRFQITIDAALRVSIHCTVKTTYKTGVEMEALHGATVAALTVYDMCKSLSHDIEIQSVRLLEKRGGKSDLRPRPLYGLVLTGGQSQRMGQDKALLEYRGQPHAQYLYHSLGSLCERVFLSARPQQWQGTILADLPHLSDSPPSVGPISGILTALTTYPTVDWLVVACDLAYFRPELVQTLLQHYRSDAVAICFRNAELGIPEPLCAIYTPKALPIFQDAIAHERYCPVKILQNSDCDYVEANNPLDLDNINTPAAYAAARQNLAHGSYHA
ncbi:MAG: cyclic pyranopterin monophosphate synthase MoaC [Synechococcales cyanobacterium]